MREKNNDCTHEAERVGRVIRPSEVKPVRTSPVHAQGEVDTGWTEREMPGLDVAGEVTEDRKFAGVGEGGGHC